jgi:hypothetical protein
MIDTMQVFGLKILERPKADPYVGKVTTRQSMSNALLHGRNEESV